MQILVFGKDGQLGKAFQQQFEQTPLEKFGVQVQLIGRSDCDLANPQEMIALLGRVKPNVIINAAAYTAVDQAESEPELAHAINARAPQLMAQYAVENGATLLHYSTDYVFDGGKAGVYIESDLRNPLSQYGKSKADGEHAIEEVFKKASKGQYAILRTSWVYGDGGNFIRTILRLAKEREALNIIQDQLGVPTSAQWLAAISLDFIFNDEWQIQKITSGIYHAVPPGQTNWYELAIVAINSAIEVGASLKLDPSNIKPIQAIEYPLPAPRPMNSRMSAQKLKKAIEARADVSKLQRWDTSWTEQVRTYVQALVKEQVI